MAEIKLPKLKKISDNTTIKSKPRKKKKKILACLYEFQIPYDKTKPKNEDRYSEE